MKSRTSCFNSVLFRKNLTRFAPVWVLYTLCLLLGMFLLLDNSPEYWFAANLASMCSGMAVINMGYALLVAQMLFGDLWNSRMCNAIHAMPIRRECIFRTNFRSGMVFSLLPTAIMAAAAEPLLYYYSVVEGSWQIPLYFLVASNAQFLFFFGLAVLAVFCSGNRTGMAVIYGICNFASYLVCFLVDTLITPMYYGVITPSEIFELFCPVVYISSNPLLTTQRHNLLGDALHPDALGTEIYGTFQLTDAWLYLGVLALEGVLLLLIAKQMYRRRSLECAGDFLSAKSLAPVFMIVFPITVGTVFQAVQMMFGVGMDEIPVFLVVGLVVGWFAGRMLLERQVNVFGEWKNWLGLVVLTLILGGVLYGLSMDPLGIEDWVPGVGDVKKVTMITSYRGTYETEDPAEIADMIRIHERILEDKLTGDVANGNMEEAYNKAREMPVVISGKMSVADMAEKIGYRQYAWITLEYELQNGLSVNRDYYMWTDSPEAELAKSYLSRLESLFYNYEAINTAQDLMKLVRAPGYLYVGDFMLPQKFLTAENVRGLLEAMIADCKAGTLTQMDGFHEGLVEQTDTRIRKGYYVDMDLVEQGLYFEIYADSENCLRWLEQTGILEYITQQRNTYG